MTYEPRLYTKKPIHVQAIEWNGSDECYKAITIFTSGLFIRETRNVLNSSLGEVHLNDYIVKEHGFIKIYQHDNFNETHSLANVELGREGDMWPEVES